MPKNSEQKLKRRRLNAKERAQIMELARRHQWKGKVFRKAKKFLNRKVRLAREG